MCLVVLFTTMGGVMLDLEGKLVIIVSAPSYRDTIYIGRYTRSDDFVVLRHAVNIVTYREVGVSGLTDQPEYANLAPSAGAAFIPIQNISVILEADEAKWCGGEYYAH